MQFPTVFSAGGGGSSPFCLDAPVADRRKLGCHPPTAFSLLKVFQKLRVLFQARCQNLPSFDLSGRPPFSPSPPVILRVSGSCEVNVSVITFSPFKVIDNLELKTCSKVPGRGGG